MNRKQQKLALDVAIYDVINVNPDEFDWTSLETLIGPLDLDQRRQLAKILENALSRVAIANSLPRIDLTRKLVEKIKTQANALNDSIYKLLMEYSDTMSYQELISFFSIDETKFSEFKTDLMFALSNIQNIERLKLYQEIEALQSGDVDTAFEEMHRTKQQTEVRELMVYQVIEFYQRHFGNVSRTNPTANYEHSSSTKFIYGFLKFAKIGFPSQFGDQFVPASEEATVKLIQKVLKENQRLKK